MALVMRFIKLLLGLAVIIPFTGIETFAQTAAMSGTVLDAGGAPVIGAAVIQKSVPSNGAITDINGSFSIRVQEGTLLQVSSIGYVTTEIPAQNDMIVVLEDDSELLEEVVVVGYGVQRKSDLTGAISSVKAEDIQGRSITHVEQALQGKTPGVNLITTSAQPGAVPTVRVRGIASNGTSDPLYVVDGLLMDDITSLDPGSIESMEVLKDAASAAIYGAQAGNGVILITTRKGSKGISSITYDFQYQLSSLARKPKLLQSQDFIQQKKESDPVFTDLDVLLLMDQGVWDGYSSTDWFNVAFGHGNTYRHSLGLQGGNDKGTFFLSVGSLDEDGIVRLDKDKYRRFSVTLNADYQIKPWLKAGANLDYANYNTSPLIDGVSLSGAGMRSPNLFAITMSQPPYVADTYAPDKLPLEQQILLDQGMKMFTNDNGDYYSVSGRLHPIVAALSAERKNYGNRLSGILFANLIPVKGLVVTSRMGFRLFDDQTYNFQHEYYGGNSYFNSSGATEVARSGISTTYYQWENFANYNRKLGKHNFGAMLGTSFSQNRRLFTAMSITSSSEDSPLFADISFPSGSANRSTSGYELTNVKLSYYGRLNYNYEERYILEATLRADAADLSVLPKDNRWGYFPSVSAGWILSKEKFFAPVKELVSFAKIRASWGQNGSTSNLSGYKYSNSINLKSAGYSFTNTSVSYVTSARPAQLYNPDLKWETSEQLDFGLDARLLKDRMSITLDWFRKNTKDLIIQRINVPYEAGNVSAPVNGGNIRNQGLELELTWKDHIGDVFYSLSGNLATLDNKVTWLNPNVSDSRIMSTKIINGVGAVTAFEEGYPIWYFRGYQVDHLDGAGDPVFRNLSGDADGAIDETDKTIIGKPLPDYTYGLTLSLAWKGLDFTVFANGTQGNDVLMCYNNSSHFTYQLKSMYDQRWTPQNPHGRYARPQDRNDNISKYLLSDAFVFDGSYLRIKQIQLGYTLPQKLTRKASVEKIRFNVSLDNYFLFTNYPGLDPEISNDAVSGIGLDLGAYPTTKKIVFGISVTL